MMRALRFTGWGETPEVQEIDTPEPGPGQVLIEVAGAGACHSDLHLMDWSAEEAPPGIEPPFTLGHENAGHVAALGAGVTGLEEGEPAAGCGASPGLEGGEPVGVCGPWGCGRCRRCRLSEENLCEHTGERAMVGG